MLKLSDLLKNIIFIIILLQIAPPVLQNFKSNYLDILEPKTKVGYLKLEGTLADSSYYTKYIKKFFKDPEIKAIMLVIESSGAAAGTAEAIANEIVFFKKEYPKPIITLSENMCTSGAYFIACATDYIIAPPSALVGNIGTVLSHQFKIKELLDHYNIHYESVKTGDFKDSTNPFVLPTPEQLAHLEGITKDSYQNFIEHVARNRTLITLTKSSDWANGKLFTGKQAQKIGLIDELGSLSNAIVYLKKIALIEDGITWVKPAKQITKLLDYLMGGFQNKKLFTPSQLEGTMDYLAGLFIKTQQNFLH